MQITFVSNYINHHQKPFCEEMIKLCSDTDTFTFIQTEEIEKERLNMGWQSDIPEYVRLAYINSEENSACRNLILESDVVIFGGCEDESYISPRLEEVLARVKKGEKVTDKITFRYSERVYKEAQWKWISPRGLKKKYHDHTRYKNCPVYLLCSGGYVASDFGKFNSYPGKMYKWGYFPKTNKYNIGELISQKGWKTDSGDKIPYLLWTGRFLDWKHPELALETAKYLASKGYAFHMDIAGGGPEEENVSNLYRKYDEECQISKYVTLLPFSTPDGVRHMMEQADIYLFTSDRNEGWGAVLNESMNSGCAVVADHMIGAVPYVLQDGKNGLIYDDSNINDLFVKAEKLINDIEYRQELAMNAYKTIVNKWNARYAAEKLKALIDREMAGAKNHTKSSNGPCSFDYPRSEKEIKKSILN